LSGRIGFSLIKSCAPEIGEMFEKNKELMHLDLSCNYFNFEDTVILAEKLEKNKTIYGIHYAGNHGYIDS
jgi:arginine deiminase